MNVIPLDTFDLAMAAALVLALAGVSMAMGLGLGRSIVVAAARTAIQLTLIGLVLKVLFAHAHLGWVALMASVMLLMAGYEVMRRQKQRLAGVWGYGIGALTMFVSAFSVTVFALAVVIRPDPWYLPQYSIPLLGMMLGNTMTGVALSIDHLNTAVSRQRAAIEGRLALGQPWFDAVDEYRRDSVRVGMIPTINAMAAAGLVSLPGMMTGQILAGSLPVDAVKYQILIMFMVAGITGFGSIGSVWLSSRRLFDRRHRLRLDRLR